MHVRKTRVKIGIPMNTARFGPVTPPFEPKLKDSHGTSMSTLGNKKPAPPGAGKPQLTQLAIDLSHENKLQDGAYPLKTVDEP
jgi:hypothetical protein